MSKEPGEVHVTSGPGWTWIKKGLRNRGVLAIFLGVLLIGGLVFNTARTTSCSNNRQDRFETAYETSSQLATILPTLPSVAFRAGVDAADREHPMIWYCFGSDR